MSESLYEVPVETLAGETRDLSPYRGQVMLVVNTASKCGFTPQYQGLQDLYDEYRDRGLVVLGFPCNQFGQQEPGDENQIGDFCQKNYGVTFPMHAKIDVNGSDTHPLYAKLKKSAKGLLGSERVKWNFTKFLVDRDGKVVERFGSVTKPEQMAEKIEELL
jgi:glutathione peroxidase